MPRFFLEIPDEKMKAFEDATRDLELLLVPEGDITEEQKKFVRKIIAETKPEDYRPWQEVMEDVRKNLEAVKNRK